MEPNRRYEERILLLLTLIIGAVVGLIVVAFILVTDRLGARLYPASGSAWRRLLIPIAGSLTAGFLLSKYFPNARGSGIPQTKTALFIRDGFISFRTVLGKFSMSSISLASGIALGREGPSVQVSAGVASVLGRKLGLGPASVKALLPVGASAALAAAFNTPIAAVLFTLEEVMGDMHAPVLGSIVLASATSWMVLHLLLGDEPLFHVPAYQLVHPLEFAVYAVLGLAGGLMSVAFVRLLLWQRKFFLKLPLFTQWWQPVAGGLTVGILGWFVPAVLGVGYNYVGQALNGEMLVKTMALLVLLKIVATATCYASGNAGGIFGPSLFMGAMLGGAVGGLAHTLMPDYTGSVGAYALVGMGAAFAGIVRVPLTSVIMIFETTRDYSIIVPLMISNLISYFVSSQLQQESIYEALLQQDGIHLPTGARAREALLMVRQAIRPAKELLQSTMTVREAVAVVRRDSGAWPVVDSGGLRGMLTVDQLDRAVNDGHGDDSLAQCVSAPNLMHLSAEEFPHVHADHTLDTAMHRIAVTGLKVLPVVGRTNVRELQGLVSVDDIMAAYKVGKAEEEAEAAMPRRKLSVLLAGLVALLALLAGVGGFLSYYFRSEPVARAKHYYEQGNLLFQRGFYSDAVEQYRDALSLTHAPEYRLALALALIKEGHLNDAELYLKEALRDHPGSAPANLAMGEVTAAQGRMDDAVAYYHHAMYGVWPPGSGDKRLTARLELIRALSTAGRRSQAQAELLSMLAAPHGDPATKKQVAPLLLANGLPKEAAAGYQEMAEQNPNDESAFFNWGEAEYQLGDYAAARDALQSALRVNPNDTAATRRLDAVNEIMALDPTRRGLPSVERFHRSQKVLSQVLGILDQCPPPEKKAAIEKARKAVAPHGPASYSDAAESATSLAEELWSAIPKSCAAQPPPDAPLSRIMVRLLAR